LRPPLYSSLIDYKTQDGKRQRHLSYQMLLSLTFELVALDSLESPLRSYSSQAAGSSWLSRKELAK
jgi:hypothetical protein